jgi:D-tyrosyl-tRNA(Tyr) deacylase
MKVVIQRVKSAQVSVEGKVVGQIQQGLVLLVGLAVGDGVDPLNWMAGKIVGLRIFEQGGLLQRSVADVGGQILAVSQFTLLGDCRKGKRPSFTAAMPPEQAKPLFDQFVYRLEQELGYPIQTGQFGAHMELTLINDGPVTLILDRESYSHSQ